MENIKLWENFNSSNGGDFYTQFWIKKLSEEFGQTTVEEFEPIERMYGGGSVSQIAYRIKLDGSSISDIILEGITDDGQFLNPSIMMFKENETSPIYHKILFIQREEKDSRSDNIEKIISKIKERVRKTEGKLRIDFK